MRQFTYKYRYIILLLYPYHIHILVFVDLSYHIAYLVLYPCNIGNYKGSLMGPAINCPHWRVLGTKKRHVPHQHSYKGKIVLLTFQLIIQD